MSGDGRLAIGFHGDSGDRVTRRLFRTGDHNHPDFEIQENTEHDEGADEDGSRGTEGANGMEIAEIQEEKTVTASTIPEVQTPVSVAMLSEIRGPLSKPWVEVVTGNRAKDNGMKIDYVPPKVVEGKVEIGIEMGDVEGELMFWENALIMYVMGRDLSMNAVRRFMEKVWSFVVMPNLYYNDEGYFIMRFKSKEDRDAVLQRGPYTIFNMTMFLHLWKYNFSLKEDMIRVLPIWVKLPRLPLFLWGPRSLGKIGSVLGKPICTDECTSSKLRVSYARILVEIDISQDIPETVQIRDMEGKVFEQVLELEGCPRYCRKCQMGGHTCPAPREEMIQKWRPKEAAVEGKTGADRGDLDAPGKSGTNRGGKEQVAKENPERIDAGNSFIEEGEELGKMQGKLMVMKCGQIGTDVEDNSGTVGGKHMDPGKTKETVDPVSPTIDLINATSLPFHPRSVYALDDLHIRSEKHILEYLSSFTMLSDDEEDTPEDVNLEKPEMENNQFSVLQVNEILPQPQDVLIHPPHQPLDSDVDASIAESPKKHNDKGLRRSSCKKTTS